MKLAGRGAFHFIRWHKRLTSEATLQAILNWILPHERLLSFAGSSTWVLNAKAAGH